MSEFQIYKSTGQGEQCWYWRLIGSDGEIIAYNEEPFLKGSIVGSIKRIRQEAPQAPIEESEIPKNEAKGYRFEYHKPGEGKQWDWYLLDGNNKVIALGKAFAPEDSAKDVLENVRKEMGDAKITWENPEDDPDYQAKHDDRTDTRGIPGS